ncbi:hypothetical protein [Paenibacillus sp. 1P07SE]
MIEEINVFTLADQTMNPGVITLYTTFSQYGIVDFDVQYWDGTTWLAVPE